MAQFPVADAHCDFLYGMYQMDYDIRTLTGEQSIHLPHLQAGGVKLQFFAAWIDTVLKTPALHQCISMIDAYERMLADNADVFTKLTPAFDLDSGKIATVLSVEGGEAIEGSLSVLRILKRLGVSAMTLTWNSNNELACAAVRRNGKGLTGLGREVVQEMNRIGIALDVSHLGDRGIEDALVLSKRPIFASHSNARGVFYSLRSLKDEHIQAIAASGGVVGVNFFHKQLCDAKDAGIEDIVKHIMHIVGIGGVRCCCIGSDFDGMTTYPRDLKNSAGLQLLCAALLQAGLSEEDVFRIAYQNLYDYILEYV